MNRRENGVTSAQLRAWLATQAGGQSHAQACLQFPLAPRESVRGALNYLRDYQHAIANRQRVDGRLVTVYALTPAGRAAAEGAKVDAPPLEHVAQPRQIRFLDAPLYDGAELARRVERAGAYDAFTKPSLQGQDRIYRAR